MGYKEGTQKKGGAKTTAVGCGGQWPTNFLIRRVSDCELMVVLVGLLPLPPVSQKCTDVVFLNF